MNKLFLALSTAAISATVLTSCNNAPKANDTKPAPTVSSELKIAYIESDSIVNQYQFAKDFTAVLQKKSTNIQNTLNGKQQAVQAAAAKLQQDYQSNSLTQEQAQSRQAAIQKQASDLDALNQRLTSEFQKEQVKYQQALQDSIDHYLAIYNKDKKYAFILTKGGVSNILYADKAYDITDEVIKGLNKTYKPSKAADETKKDKK